MERKPHHIQTGASVHTGMGSLQHHSNGNALSFHFNSSGEFWRPVLLFHFTSNWCKTTVCSSDFFRHALKVSKWIRNSQENNGILVVTTFPSGNWMESSSKQNGELTNTNAYLVIFSDDGRPGISNQSYLGKMAWMFFLQSA